MPPPSSTAAMPPPAAPTPSTARTLPTDAGTAQEGPTPKIPKVPTMPTRQERSGLPAGKRHYRDSAA
eukprot:1818631-Heterocapsa_arctica.AAC.1